MSGTLKAVWPFFAKAGGAVVLSYLSGGNGNPFSMAASSKEPNSYSAYLAYIQAALIIACGRDDFSKSFCGTQLAQLIPGFSGDVGEAVNDGLAVVGVACAVTANPVTCGITAVYALANAVYNLLSDLFGWGDGPQFTGSLLPRPGVPGMQGSSSFGVPVRNLAIPGLQ